MRLQRIARVVTDYKAERAKANALCCEVCGWRPPPGLRHLDVVADDGIHAHHVVPISCHGRDHADNLILLCPNHHFVAHRMGRQRRRTWKGPTCRESLVAEILLLEADPVNYAALLAQREADAREVSRAIMEWAKGGPVPLPPYLDQQRDERQISEIDACSQPSDG